MGQAEFIARAELLGRAEFTGRIDSTGVMEFTGRAEWMVQAGFRIGSREFGWPLILRGMKRTFQPRMVRNN